MLRKGPVQKLAVDIQKLEKYFPLGYGLGTGPKNHLQINRQVFEKVQGLLADFDVYDPAVAQEFCFILLWIEEELVAGADRDDPSGKYYLMWKELNELRDYFQHHRITSVHFKGEYAKNQPGEELSLHHPHNIDRLCDGIRWAFNNEFQNKKAKKGRFGHASWERKKMSAIKHNFIEYLDAIKELEARSFESYFYIIGYISALAGYFFTEEEFQTSNQLYKKYVSYREYLVQSVRSLK